MFAHIWQNCRYLFLLKIRPSPWMSSRSATNKCWSGQFSCTTCIVFQAQLDIIVLKLWLQCHKLLMNICYLSLISHYWTSAIKLLFVSSLFMHIGKYNRLCFHILYLINNILSGTYTLYSAALAQLGFSPPKKKW